MVVKITMIDITAGAVPCRGGMIDIYQKEIWICCGQLAMAEYEHRCVRWLWLLTVTHQGVEVFKQILEI